MSLGWKSGSIVRDRAVVPAGAARVALLQQTQVERLAGAGAALFTFLPAFEKAVHAHAVHAEADLLGGVAVAQRQQLGEVEDRDIELLPQALQRGLVEVELLEAVGADHDQRVDLVLREVAQLAACHVQGAVAVADAVERAAAALHLARVVHDARPERRDERLDPGRLQRVVPADGRLGTQQVAAVVHGQAHAAEGAHGAAGHGGGAFDRGEVLREVVHLQVLGPGEVLFREGLVHSVALRAVQREVTLGLLEGGVAAVAGREQVEAGAADDGEVARGDQVVQVRVAGLHQRAFRAAGMPFEFAGLHVQVLEDEARGLLDRREARGDGASPEHRVVPHAASFLTPPPLRPPAAGCPCHRHPGTRTLPGETLAGPAGERRCSLHVGGTPSCRRACSAEPSSTNGSCAVVTRPSATPARLPSVAGP